MIFNRSFAFSFALVAVLVTGCGKITTHHINHEASTSATTANSAKGSATPTPTPGANAPSGNNSQGNGNSTPSTGNGTSSGSGATQPGGTTNPGHPASTPTPTPAPAPDSKIDAQIPNRDTLEITLSGKDANLLYQNMGINAEAVDSKDPSKGSQKVGENFTCFEQSASIHSCVFPISRPDGTAVTVRKRRKLDKNKNKPTAQNGTYVQIKSGLEIWGINAILAIPADISSNIITNSGIDFTGNSTPPDFRLTTTTNKKTGTSVLTLSLLIDLRTGSVGTPPENDSDDLN